MFRGSTWQGVQVLFSDSEIPTVQLQMSPAPACLSVSQALLCPVLGFGPQGGGPAWEPAPAVGDRCRQNHTWGRHIQAP